MRGFKVIHWAPPHQPHPDSGAEPDLAIWISVAKIEASWVRDINSYIAPGGVGGVENRYEKFGIWLMSSFTPVEPVTISIDQDSDGIVFTDGRHRFAWLRDHGATAIQAQVPSCYAEDVARRFGTEDRITLITI
jgi:hypothetical protein